MKTSLIKSTFAVAAAFAASSALAGYIVTNTAASYLSENFDSKTTGLIVSNAAEWVASGEGDASEVVSDGNYVSSANALKLSTEGQTLSRVFDSTESGNINTAVAADGVVFEAQVKFVASDTITDPFDPSKAEEAANKFAIYAYAPDEGSATNLVVYHSYYYDDEHRVCVNEVFDSVDIDTGDFTKIKVEIKDGSVDSELGLYLFRVFVGDSDTAIVSEYDISGEGGEWMLSANDPGADYRALSALCFKGTGYVDDLAVKGIDTYTEYVTATFTDDKNNTSDSTNVVKSAFFDTPAAPTFAGFDFGGWFDGTTTNAAGASISIDADTTFAALWEAQSSGGDTPVPASDGANTFTVPATEANAIATAIGAVDAATALATDTGKGTTYGQAYALGLLTIDNGVATVADLPAATITFNADGEPVVTFENGMTADADYTVTTQLEKATTIGGAYSTVGEPVALGTTMTDPNPGTAGFYKIRITISNK